MTYNDSLDMHAYHLICNFDKFLQINLQDVYLHQIIWMYVGCKNTFIYM